MPTTYWVIREGKERGKGRYFEAISGGWVDNRRLARKYDVKPRAGSVFRCVRVTRYTVAETKRRVLSSVMDVLNSMAVTNQVPEKFAEGFYAARRIIRYTLEEMAAEVSK